MYTYMYMHMYMHVYTYTRVWFSRHGGVGLMVGLHDLRGLFQP